MDKEKIDLEVYDKCVDASVALFMQYYCAAVSEDIHKEILEMQAEEKVFPETLDTRCRTAIKKENSIRKRRQYRKALTRVLCYVAAFAVVLLALTSILFLSVEAVRVPIINYYISRSDVYLEIGPSDAGYVDSAEQIDFSNPLNGLLPAEYSLTSLEVNPLGEVLAIYENRDNGKVFLAMDKLNSTKRIDVEGAQTIQEFQCLGHDVVLIENENVITVAWGNDTLDKTFLLRTSEFSADEVISIVSAFIEKLP